MAAAAAAPSGKRSPATVVKASRRARTARGRSTPRSQSVHPRRPRPTDHPERQSRAPGDSGNRAWIGAAGARARRGRGLRENGHKGGLYRELAEVLFIYMNTS